MKKFPSQAICLIIYVFSFNLYIGCDNQSPPLEQRQMSSIAPAPEFTQTVALLEASKIEEVVLDTMVIIGHPNGGVVPALGVTVEESEDAACKMADSFLVVPLLSETGTYPNCGDQENVVYMMKLVNCTKEKLVLSMLTFTVTLHLGQEENEKSVSADEFIHFELHVDSDQTSYISSLKHADHKTSTVITEEMAIELEAGEPQFCQLRATRHCSDRNDRLEFNLDLTGAFVSKGEEGVVSVSGAVFGAPDRQVTFISRD